MSRGAIQALSAKERTELGTWLGVNGATLPAPVLKALAQHGALVEALSGSKRKLGQVLTELRRALGITPASERRPSRDGIGPTTMGDGRRPKTQREKLELNVQRSCHLAQWHQGLARKKRKQTKELQEKLSRLPPEDIKLSAEEEEASAQQTREMIARAERGDGADAALQPAKETLMTSPQVEAIEQTDAVKAPVDEDDADIKVVGKMIEKRERYDFSFSVTRVTVEVEKKVVIGADGERRMVSGSTAHIGPAGFSVTWGFLAHVAILVVQYAMPLNRLGKLLSTQQKKFTAGTLGRLLHYVAVRFAPIYIELIGQLADSDILLGDDTGSRVVEVSRYFAQDPPEQPPPWAPYRNSEAAWASVLVEQNTSLAAEIAGELGFEFDRRNGPGTKKALNTTTIAGRAVPDDPRSLIVAYRTHLGGFGNLLEILLRKRRPSARKVTVQSDLATVNLVTDPELLTRFDIRYVGCLSHARRPFALYEDEDPQYCDYILHMFKGLAIYEHCLDVRGRNRENVFAVRDVDSRELWREIKETAEEMTKRWSSATKLGAGARYIIRHFDKLTAYLDDPRLEPTNNFSERMLRMEKQMQASSLFRRTLEGRFVMDIMRTVLQTATAAGVPLNKYLLHVLRADEDKVAEAPELYTPRAWARSAQQPSEAAA